METSIKPISKKDRILSLYEAGGYGLGELASLTHSSLSYVATVLRQAEALPGYFDLYTTTDQPMNIYSKLFAKRLGFKTEKVAQRSIRYINRLYQHFAHIGDRAGQHHALVMALTMFNRARWSKKSREAEVFRTWLMNQLSDTYFVWSQPKERDRVPVQLKH